MSDSYLPDSQLLQKYADLLVNLDVGDEEVIHEGDVVECTLPDTAREFAPFLQTAILKTGAHPFFTFSQDDLQESFYANASQKQLEFFPEKYFKEKADSIDREIYIIADDLDPTFYRENLQKILVKNKAQKVYRDMLRAKGTTRKFSTIIALWGTEQRAQRAGLTLSEYWQEISRSCLLNTPDPVAAWQRIFTQQKKIVNTLNAMNIKNMKVESSDIQLSITVGEQRQWLLSHGHNIPSFEVFLSPDSRYTEGTLMCNQPIFQFGTTMKNVFLKFQKGIVTEAHAETGNDTLQEILQVKNFNRIGEFSFTDKRLSSITHPMAATLYDENISGENGNMHIALGRSFARSFTGSASSDISDLVSLGFNDCQEHIDFINTEDKKVTAVTADGSEFIIYEHGMFTFSIE